MRYIYRQFIGIHKKYKSEYIEIYTENYFTRKEAISVGVKNIRFFIENRCKSIEDFLKNYDYEFYVYITDLNHISFENYKDRNIYYNQNKNNSDLYGLLTTIAESVYEIYDYNGYFKFGLIYPEISRHWELELSYKSTFKPTDLKVGDLVKKKGYDELYKITELPNYKDDDILSYTDGVYILPIDEFDEENAEIYSHTELIKQ